MPDLQATWMPEEHLFFWSSGQAVDDAIQRELPALDGLGEPAHHVLAWPDPSPRRRRVEGRELDLRDAAPLLARIPLHAPVSDGLRCWALASLLALELAAGQRVFPTVRGHQARWRALLTRTTDRERFEALVGALPVASRAVPTSGRGAIQLPPAVTTLRAFLDATIDAVYRVDTYPGPARGWELQLAEALRSDDAAFNPRDARFLGVPAMLETWAAEAEATGLRLGMTLSLPEGDDDGFGLAPWLHPPNERSQRIPLEDAWQGGETLEVDGVAWEHPAHAAIRGLARAARVFPPLLDCLDGDRPQPARWDAHQVWEFLSGGADRLRDAGFEVQVPPAFEEAGDQRLRARIHLVGEPDQQGELALSDLLRFRWEIVLGDRVIDGNEFAELVDRDEPVVHYQGGWVFLDPDELARLPEGLPQEGALPAAQALRAILTGEHDGVPVVADQHLQLIVEALRTPPDEPVPEGFQGTLRPYQQDGYQWLVTLGRLGLGALLADDMGLGKTVQVIAYLLQRRAEREGPVLIACPTSVLANWQRELHRFGPDLRVLRYHGLDREIDDLEATDVVLTTYGLLARDLEQLEPIRWDVIVLDEAQAIKNPDSQRARAARSLDAAHRVAMTGTPVENRLDELWSLMEFLSPGLLGPRRRFRREVAVPVERFGDAEAAEQLRRGIRPFLLRRVKTDPTVISDLPDKIEQRRYCGLTREQADLYQQILEEHLERITGAEGMDRRGRVLAMLTALKQVCNHPAQYRDEGEQALEDRSGKLEALVMILDDILEDGDRVLVFTQYREMGDLLQRHLADVYGEQAPFLHGGTPAHKRAEMVQAFQEDPDAPPVLLVSLRAGGTGLNLTAATHVIHYDRWWNPAVEDQATDRAYRIGQRENVLVHKLITEGTLEERIDRMLEEKRELAEQIVGGGEGWVTELDDAALRDLVALGTEAMEDD